MKASWFLLGAGSVFVAFILPIVIAVIVITVQARSLRSTTGTAEQVRYVYCGDPGVPPCKSNAAPSAAPAAAHTAWPNL